MNPEKQGFASSEVKKVVMPEDAKAAAATPIVPAEIRSLLEHPDPRVRYGAQQILGAMGAPQFLRAMGGPQFDVNEELRSIGQDVFGANRNFDGQITGLGDAQKSSPLISQTHNPVRPPTSPPATQPLSATSASRVGSLDAMPGQAVDELQRVVMHRHSGQTEDRSPYMHAHPYDLPVGADPTETGLIDFDTPSHLRDPRHTSANDRFEAKGVGTSIDHQIRALEGHIEEMAATYGKSRDFNLRQYSREEIQKAGNRIAELVDVRTKLSRASTNKRARATTTKAMTYGEISVAVRSEVTKALQPAIARMSRQVADLSRLPVVAEGATKRIGNRRPAVNPALRSELEKMAESHRDASVRAGARQALQDMDASR
jgi:hypothetical protein